MRNQVESTAVLEGPFPGKGQPGDSPDAVAALRESEEKYAKVFQTSPHGIVITRFRDGRILEVNDTFAAVTGHTREELTGRTIPDMGFWVRAEDRSDLMESLDRAGSIRKGEVQFRIRPGRILTCQVHTQRLRIGGEDCLLTSIADITERKRVEEALRESESGCAWR